LRVVDLFCGCGGFSLGFDFLEDFELVYALDNWSVACKSYHTNFSQVDVDCRNALEIKPFEIPKCDVVIGSPPCQDFSCAKMKRRKPDLSLVKWFLSVIECIKPKFWIMENVPQLRKYISCSSKIFAMNDYGVPQIRKRLFAGVYNEPRKEQISLAFPTVLADESRWKSSLYLKEHGIHGKFGKKGLGVSSAFRRFSLISEIKLIQTFPLDFVIHGSLKERYRQIGNAVPPFMAYRLAEAIVNPQYRPLHART